MTQFDTIFSSACKSAGLSWMFVYDNGDRTIKVDQDIYDYPCVLRMFREPLLPNFDQRQTVSRSMSLYIIHVGFNEVQSEVLSEHMEDIMNKFIILRESLKRSGIEITINGNPTPGWLLTNLDDYGYIFDLTAKYSICQS